MKNLMVLLSFPFLLALVGCVSIQQQAMSSQPTAYIDGVVGELDSAMVGTFAGFNNEVGKYEAWIGKKGDKYACFTSWNEYLTPHKAKGEGWFNGTASGNGFFRKNNPSNGFLLEGNQLYRVFFSERLNKTIKVPMNRQ